MFVNIIETIIITTNHQHKTVRMNFIFEYVYAPSTAAIVNGQMLSHRKSHSALFMYSLFSQLSNFKSVTADVYAADDLENCL